MAGHPQTFVLPPAAFAFIVLKDGTGDVDVVVKELRSVVADKIANYAVPDQVLVSGCAPGAAVSLLSSLLLPALNGAVARARCCRELRV